MKKKGPQMHTAKIKTLISRIVESIFRFEWGHAETFYEGSKIKIESGRSKKITVTIEISE